MKRFIFLICALCIASTATAFDLVMQEDTALAEVPVNIYPLVDATDGVTIEAAIVYNEAGMDLRWNFVTADGAMTSTAVTPTTAGDYDWTHQGDGIYTIEIPASGGASINNDTAGYGWFSGNTTASAPWRGPIVMIANTDDTNTGIASTTDIDRSNGVIKAYEQIAAYTSQTVFTLTTGPADDDALNGHVAIIHENGTDDRQSAMILDYTGSSKTVTLAADPGVFTFDGDDYVVVISGYSNPKMVSDDATAADNLESAADNYSATRGLAGTALPAAAADAAGGLPVKESIDDLVWDSAETFDGATIRALITRMAAVFMGERVITEGATQTVDYKAIDDDAQTRVSIDVDNGGGGTQGDRTAVTFTDTNNE